MSLPAPPSSRFVAGAAAEIVLAVTALEVIRPRVAVEVIIESRP